MRAFPPVHGRPQARAAHEGGRGRARYVDADTGSSGPTTEGQPRFPLIAGSRVRRIAHERGCSAIDSGRVPRQGHPHTTVRARTCRACNPHRPGRLHGDSDGCCGAWREASDCAVDPHRAEHDGSVIRGPGAPTAQRHPTRERPADEIPEDDDAADEAKSWTVAEIEQFREAAQTNRLYGCWLMSRTGCGDRKCWGCVGLDSLTQH